MEAAQSGGGEKQKEEEEEEEEEEEDWAGSSDPAYGGGLSPLQPMRIIVTSPKMSPSHSDEDLAGSYSHGAGGGGRGGRGGGGGGNGGEIESYRKQQLDFSPAVSFAEFAEGSEPPSRPPTAGDVGVVQHGEKDGDGGGGGGGGGGGVVVVGEGESRPATSMTTLSGHVTQREAGFRLGEGGAPDAMPRQVQALSPEVEHAQSSAGGGGADADTARQAGSDSPSSRPLSPLRSPTNVRSSIMGSNKRRPPSLTVQISPSAAGRERDASMPSSTPSSRRMASPTPSSQSPFASMNRLNSSKNIDVGSSSFVSIRDARRMGLLELASSPKSGSMRSLAVQGSFKTLDSSINSAIDLASNRSGSILDVVDSSGRPKTAAALTSPRRASFRDVMSATPGKGGGGLQGSRGRSGSLFDEAVVANKQSGDGSPLTSSARSMMKRWSSVKSVVLTADSRHRAAFDSVDTDGSGFVDGDELRVALTNLGFEVKQEEVVSLIREHAKGQKDEIGFTQFVEIMRAVEEKHAFFTDMKIFREQWIVKSLVSMSHKFKKVKIHKGDHVWSKEKFDAFLWLTMSGTCTVYGMVGKLELPLCTIGQGSLFGAGIVASMVTRITCVVDSVFLSVRGEEVIGKIGEPIIKELSGQLSSQEKLMRGRVSDFKRVLVANGQSKSTLALPWSVFKKEDNKAATMAEAIAKQRGTGSIEAPGPMKRDLSTKRLRPSTAMGLNSPHRRGIPPRPGSVPLGETRSGLAGTARLGVGALGEGLGSSKPMPKSERKPLMRSRGKRESASSLPRKVPKEEYHVQIDTDTMTYDDL